ncbi:unnamed protein product [Clavelina lepadiformis]|uniref:Proteasome-associated protein ECM29 homolog n=1 Tax=Clavelina lepadiformis TaxID=159417 RepID=A0ABP0G134_CLALP
METPQSINEKLELIFLQLGLAESDEQLEKLLDTYLTPVLSKLSSIDSSVRTKVLEVLAHINKRIKSRGSVQLPIKQLINQLNDVSLTGFVTNFTIIYLKTGFPRLPVNEQLELSSTLFKSIEVAILNLMKSGLIPLNEIVCHLIIGSCDTRHAVATSADLELRNQLSLIDWEKPEICTELYNLYLGHAASKSQKQMTDSKREPANIRMKLKLLQYLTRSKTAGEYFPLSIQVIYDGLFGKTNDKVAILALQFVHHILNSSLDPTILHKQAGLFLDCLLKVAQNSESSDRLRSMAYTGLGKLSQRTPKLFSKRMDIISSLFDALTKDLSAELKISIQGAVSSVAQAYKDVPTSSTMLIESLIESSIGGNNRYLKMAGVQCAEVMFPRDHIQSCYQLLLALGDESQDISGEARKILMATVENRRFSPSKLQKLPSFSGLLTYVVQMAHQRLLRGQGFSIGNKMIYFSPSTYQAILLYLHRCLLTESGVINSEQNMDTRSMFCKHIGYLFECDRLGAIEKMADFINLMFHYLQAVSDPVVVSLFLEVVASCPDDIPIDKLMCTKGNGKGSYDDALQPKLIWLRKLTAHANDDIRSLASELFALVFRRSVSSFNSQYDGLILEVLKSCSSKDFVLKHGSILFIGHIVGDYLKTHVKQNLSWAGSDNILPTIQSAIYRLVVILQNEHDPVLCGGACFALGEIARNAPLPLPDETMCNTADDTVNVASAVTKLSVVEVLLKHLTKNTSHKLRELAVNALGLLPVGSVSFPYTEMILDNLLNSAEIGDTEYHFTVGNALCNAALGPLSPENCNKWTGKLNYLVGTTSHEDKVEWLVNKILKDYVVHRIPSVRQASCIWLLVMLKTSICAKHSGIQKNLFQLQQAFHSLLSETDGLTQDIASKGFGIVYDLADVDQKKVLVNQLVESLTNTINKPPSKVRIIGQDGSSLYEGASVQLGNAPDGSKLSTYKELCSLASDLNQPDLVYKFLHLANHHALWNTKKGAAFGFRSIATAAREHLKPYLPSIVPRLYRYIFDPQSSVQAAMTSIWNVLADEPNKLVRIYINLILDDLIKNLTSNLWRIRQASCLALSDILRNNQSQKSLPNDGKEVEENPADAISRRLSELWSTVFRVLDDIKESVRDAANKTCKMLKKFSVQLFDETRSTSSKENIMVDVLTVLLEGLNSNVDAVRSISLSTLIEFSRVGGKLIKPCVSKMVIALVETLSSSEAQVINYLQNRGDEDTQTAVDLTRIEMVKSNPLMETALRCIEQTDDKILKDLAPALADLTKRGVGVLTKAGCAQAMEKLVSVCGEDLSPYAAKLITALTSGLLDRSLAVQKISSRAIGHITRIAKDSSINKTLSKMRQWYLEKEDASAKRASGSAVYAIAQVNPDAITRHSTLVLPLAFYGMHEEPASSTNLSRSSTESSNSSGMKLSNQEMWQAIWVEFTPGYETALRLHTREIVELLSSVMNSNNWGAKIQAAASISSLLKKQKPGTVVGHDLDDVLKTLLSGLKGRIWEGKIGLVEALRDVGVHCAQSLTEADRDLVISTLFKESERQNAVYRARSLAALGSVLSVHQRDEFIKVWQLARIHLQKEISEGSDSDGETSASNRSKTNMRTTQLQKVVLNSVCDAWPNYPSHTHVLCYKEVFSDFADLLSRSAYAVQIVTLKSMTTMLKALKRSDIPLNADVTFTEDRGGDRFDDLPSLLVGPVSSCLGNVKYLAVCEEAFKVAEVQMELCRGGQCPRLLPDNVNVLTRALQESPLNSSKSEYQLRLKTMLKAFEDMQ